MAGAGKDGRLIGRRLMSQRRLGAFLAATLFGVALVGARAGDMSQQPVASLLRQANGSDPAARLEATRELFRRGRSVVPQLERAGAKPMHTLSAPRGDVIYSLLSGKLGPAAAPDSFGLHVEPNVTATDIARMGAAHGFRLIPQPECRPDQAPSCYVSLLPGRRLADVLRDVLTSEAGVTTVTLNYVER